MHFNSENVLHCLISKLLYKNRLLSFYSKIQMFTIVFAVNRSTFTIINFPCIFFLHTGNYVYIYLENCISILAEKSYLSPRINDQFCLWHTTTATKAVCKSCRFPVFVPFSLSSITLHNLMCETTIPFSVS